MITETVEEIFLDTRKNKPRDGDIIAKYRAVADFVEGDDKDIVVNLLRENPMGSDMSVHVLKNKCGAIPIDAIKVALKMAEDLTKKTDVEVKKTPYRMIVEFLFYAKKENVPNDPHWEVIPILKTEC